MTSPPGMRVIPVIAGPTASGKSELGIELALKLDAEIVNFDSIQAYRRLEIATAKVPHEERRGVPHHLIDFIEPADPFTAGDYAERARLAVEEIESRRKTVIMVGGTGFYLRALIRPLFQSPATDAGLRDRLQQLLAAKGPQHLHRMLNRIDPAAASSISPRNWSRTARALEFYFQTGGRISEARVQTPEAPGIASRIRVIVLNPPREELYDRINRRADRMWREGLVEEVKSLIASGVPSTAKAFQAHGYKRVVEYLEGRRSLEDALEQMKLDTRHYAKRQLTWWRAWPGVKWINGFGSEPESVAVAYRHIAEAIGGQ